MASQAALSVDKWIVNKVSTNDTLSIYNVAHQYIDIIDNERNNKDRFMDDIRISDNNRDIIVTFLELPPRRYNEICEICNESAFAINARYVFKFFWIYNQNKNFNVAHYTSSKTYNGTEDSFKLFSFQDMDVLDTRFERNTSKEWLHNAVNNIREEWHMYS